LFSSWLCSYRENDLRRRGQELIASGKAEVWDEDKTPFRKELALRGESYKPQKLFDSPLVGSVRGFLAAEDVVVCPGDPKFYYVNLRFPKGEPMKLFRQDTVGHAWFTTAVTVPVLAEKRPGTTPTTWMSLTPMEMQTQRAAVWLATGTVLIGGLGLGWLLRKVCEKPSVTRVIVIESNPALLIWMQARLVTLYPALSKVTDWLAGDVYDHIGRHGDDTRHLLDIWPTYGCAAWDNKFEAAKGSVKHLWGWGRSKGRR